MVAPFAGAWIEINHSFLYMYPSSVAPFAGAWIEIRIFSLRYSLICVAPFAGAWIEIACEIISVAGMNGRSLRGSVD